MSVLSTHNAGFFSCCSMKLENIVSYINSNKKIPEFVDSSTQFELYKNNNSNDITYHYFAHYDNFRDIVDINPNYHINYTHKYQFMDYSKLDYHNIVPLIQKYFSPSNNINHIICNLEQKYKLNYDNICVLFHRGGDKKEEITLCQYDEYLQFTTKILKENPNIKFLLQSDENAFIEFMKQRFPNNYISFDDELQHLRGLNHLDPSNRYTNYQFSKLFLSIIIIMSKSKYIVCGSGNCSMWMMFYRGHCKNVFQNLNSHFYNRGMKNVWFDHSEPIVHFHHFDKEQQKTKIHEKYINKCTITSDINQHLPTLYFYALECSSIVECGVRGVVSSWAFLNGLVKDDKPKKYMLNDLYPCDVTNLLDAAKGLNVDIQCKWINDIELKLDQNYDLLFIDTWHIYGQLKRELNHFKDNINKYIIMHDTTVDGEFGETLRTNMDGLKQSQETGIPLDEIYKGLMPAIYEFLTDNPNWVIKEIFENNNGLTVLERIY